MKKFLLLLIFLNSCTTSSVKENLKQNLNFSKDMSFEDFRLNLKKYEKQSNYPNLNE